MGYWAHWCDVGCIGSIHIVRCGGLLVYCGTWWLIGVLQDVMAHWFIVGCGGSLVYSAYGAHWEGGSLLCSRICDSLACCGIWWLIPYCRM
jgi:hypothetical protein